MSKIVPEDKPVSALPKTVQTEDDARMLVDWCLSTIGIGYHPDTLAEDYIDLAHRRRRTFTDAQAKELDRLHTEAFDAGFGDLMYEHGLDGIHAIVGSTPAKGA